MVVIVDITYGTELSYPPPKVANIGCIIGYSTVIPATNPFTATTIADITAAGIPTSSELYKACEDVFNGAGKLTKLFVYAISTTQTIATIENVNLLGALNITNTTFISPYIPCTAISGLELNFNGSGWFTQDKVWNHDVPPTFTINSESIWHTGTTAGIVDGSVVLKALNLYTGLVWSGTSEGIVSGTTLGTMFTNAENPSLLRADITINTSGMGDAFETLKEAKYNFNKFCFAYDHALGCPADPAGGATYKYMTTKCYGNSGWLHDLLLGANMVSSFNSVGKRCMFLFSYPSISGAPATLPMYDYASGTTYSGSTYADVVSLIGANYNIISFADWQTTLGADPAAAWMGSILAEHPRTMLTYKPVPVNISQTSFPSKPIIQGWRQGKVNPLMTVTTNGQENVVLGGNTTFGNGREKDANFVACRHLLADTILDNLQTLLMSRKLKYNLDGIIKIESSIYASMKLCVTNGWIDGVGTVTIPIKPYLLSESSLDTGSKIILETARQSKIVGDISVTFKWEGDVEEIIIRYLGVD